MVLIDTFTARVTGYNFKFIRITRVTRNSRPMVVFRIRLKCGAGHSVANQPNYFGHTQTELKKIS